MFHKKNCPAVNEDLSLRTNKPNTRLGNSLWGVLLEPEFIKKQDGHQKQDCENAAAKRWIEQYAKRYAQLGITILGDDLYCHQPLCELILQQQLNFILVCQPESHKPCMNG